MFVFLKYDLFSIVRWLVEVIVKLTFVHQLLASHCYLATFTKKLRTLDVYGVGINGIMLIVVLLTYRKKLMHEYKTRNQRNN